MRNVFRFCVKTYWMRIFFSRLCQIECVQVCESLWEKSFSVYFFCVKNFLMLNKLSISVAQLQLGKRNFIHGFVASFNLFYPNFLWLEISKWFPFCQQTNCSTNLKSNKESFSWSKSHKQIQIFSYRLILIVLIV